MSRELEKQFREAEERINSKIDQDANTALHLIEMWLHQFELRIDVDFVRLKIGCKAPSDRVFALGFELYDLVKRYKKGKTI